MGTMVLFGPVVFQRGGPLSLRTLVWLFVVLVVDELLFLKKKKI